MAHLKDFDLALHTKWFTKEPPAFPLASMKALGPCTSTYNWFWEQDFTDTTRTLICAVRWTDTKAITKVRVSWKRSDPLGTVSAQQKHFPAPAALSEEELDAAHKLYGANIATWAESTVGSTVGDGECWTLIQRALIDLAETYRQYGKEPPMVSQGRSHGYPILTLTAPTSGSNSGLLQLADVRRGDIVELKSAHFHIITEEAPKRVPGQWGKWQKGAGEKNIRLSHHTAVVLGVDGDTVRVVEQNGCVSGGVGLEKYDLGQMIRGEVSSLPLSDISHIETHHPHLTITPTNPQTQIKNKEMASILIAGGYLAYEKVAAKRAKKAERKAEKKAYDRRRFSELERENAERIRALQEKTEFCGRSDWDGERGGGCGGGGGGGGVPAAGMRNGEGQARSGDRPAAALEGQVRREEGVDAVRLAGRKSGETRRTSQENPFATTTLPSSSTPSSSSAHLQPQPQQLHHQQDHNRDNLNRTPTSATTGSTENHVLDNYARSREEADGERALQVPDVRGVMPVYRDEKACRKSLKQRVLRRRGPCESRGVR
ncbi:MAG: hypothetical protein Q9184_008049 [Pyrenodesmia sp. 2 TL-2023]